MYAIAGAQGCGKSTLAAQVAALARTRGLRAIRLSIDDVYLGPRARRALARRVHPLLAIRGPPGTHDPALACEILDALREGRRIRLPRFDKAGDRRWPPSRWPWADAGADLTIFEGWFLKTPAQPDAALRRPLNALEREDDPDGVWRRYCNEALRHDYTALWARLDRLLFLRAPGFAPVAGWRWEQEQRLRAKGPRHRTMTRSQVEHFVQHFERISRHALDALPAIAERTVSLDEQRGIVQDSATGTPSPWPRPAPPHVIRRRS